METPIAPQQRVNTPLPFVQQQPQVVAATTKPAAAAHTSTAFINLESDFKQPLNITSNKFRSESPIRQTATPSPVNKQVNKPATDTSDFKQPAVHKIRSESPVRQPAVIPLPAPLVTKQEPTPQPVRSESPVRQPIVIPLPPPPSISKQETQQQQAPSVPQQPTMGNTLNGQNSNKKSHASTNVNTTDTTDTATAATATHQSTFYVPTAPQTATKTAQDKCDDIACELENLHQAVNQFSGNNKKDKNYLKLDEMLTRCLLKLDDIGILSFKIKN